MDEYRIGKQLCLLLLGLSLPLAGGCRLTGHHDGPPPVIPNTQAPGPAVFSNAPRELSMTVMPPYRIEPPDILFIEAISAVPRAPLRLSSLDAVLVQVRNALPDAPIDAVYTVEPGGFINLGLPYGRVRVLGLTLEEAVAALEQHLSAFLRDPEVSISLMQVAAQQLITGEHLVAPDGTISLGVYGRVSVVGRTIPEARLIIEQHLAQFLENPQIAIDVWAYNSKVFYVITEGAGLGDHIVRFPITGNETVLDALSLVQGLDAVSSKTIWVARPAPSSVGCPQILPVDYCAIAKAGITDTNYQLLPGDRVFIQQDCWVAADTWIGKVISPVERVFGFVALGTSTLQQIKFFDQGPFGFFGAGL